MPINGEALLDAVKFLAEEEEVRQAWRCTARGSVAASIASCGGFLVLGPPGLFLGATAAGIGAYFAAKNKFKPMFRILKEDLTPAQLEKLKELLCEAFREFCWQDVASVLAVVSDKRELKVKMFTIVQTYLMKQVLTSAATSQPVVIEVNPSGLIAAKKNVSTPLAPPVVGREIDSASQEYHMMSRFEQVPLQQDNSEWHATTPPSATVRTT